MRGDHLVDGVGTLKAFNTDGLRSLIHTLRVPFMKEKTLRYPGHIQPMEAFRETGFFSKEPLVVGDVSVRPLDWWRRCYLNAPGLQARPPQPSATSGPVLTGPCPTLGRC